MEESKINDQKNDKNVDIDYSLYEEQPEKLFPLAQENFNKNKFEEGLAILEKSIMLAIKKYGGEEKIEVAKFNNQYADGLIQKLMVTNVDYLNLQDEETHKEEETQKEEEITKEKKDELADNVDNSKNGNKINENEKKNEGEEKINSEKEKKENDDYNGDEEIVYENLSIANSILKNYLKEYNDLDPKSLDKEIIKYYLQLSNNYSLFASLEKINSDFKKANDYYKLSIDICRKYDKKFSRNLAGLYFEQAQIMDFDPKNCLLSLYKSKIIMEHYLQMELDKINLGIKLDIDEKDLDLDTLSHESELIFKNKDLIIKNDQIIKAAKENSDIEEFVDIIKDINIKIEDVVLELKEYNNYLKIREQMKKEGEKQDCFNTNIDMSKVMDLTKFAMIKKKRTEPINDKSDINKPEEINPKEKLIK